MSSKSKPSIVPTPARPYLVKDLKKLTSQKGRLDTQEAMALCRCGGSANKPFCDGAHWYNKFTDDKN